MAIERVQADQSTSAGAQVDLAQHAADVEAAIDAAGPSGPGGTDNPGFVEGVVAAVAGGPVAAVASIFLARDDARAPAAPHPNAQMNPTQLDSRFAGHLQVVTKATATPTPIVPLSYSQKKEQMKRAQGMTASAANKGVPLGVRANITSMSLTGGPVKTSPGKGVKLNPELARNLLPSDLKEELDITRRKIQTGEDLVDGSNRLETEARNGKAPAKEAEKKGPKTSKRNKSAQAAPPGQPMQPGQTSAA